MLLTLSAFFWAGNAIAGKLAAGVLTPVALTWYRWLIASLLLFVVARGHLTSDRAELLRHVPRLLVLGALGLAGFNLALYSALHHTTAVNATMEQACMPMLAVVGAYLLWR